MDKRKIILAYRRGMITTEECAKILGVDSVTIIRYIEEMRVEGNGAVSTNVR